MEALLHTRIRELEARVARLEKQRQSLGRAPQTLRLWASGENGPLRPLRINGRLAWPTAEIRRLLGVA